MSDMTKGERIVIPAILETARRLTRFTQRDVQIAILANGDSVHPHTVKTYLNFLVGQGKISVRSGGRGATLVYSLPARV